MIESVDESDNIAQSIASKIAIFGLFDKCVTDLYFSNADSYGARVGWTEGGGANTTFLAVQSTAHRHRFLWATFLSKIARFQGDESAPARQLHQ